MLEALAGIGGGVVSTIFGGVTGIVDKHLNNRHSLAMEKEKNSHEDKQAQKAIDLSKQEGINAENQITLANAGKLAVAKQEAAAAKFVADTEAEAARDVADAGLVERALEHDNKIEGNDWVAKFRKMMRPGITVYLLVYVSAIGIISWVSDGEGLYDLPDGTPLFTYITITFCHLLVFCISFWFGGRAKSVIKGVGGVVRGK